MYQGDEGQVRDFALHKIANRPDKAVPAPVINPQLVFDLTNVKGKG
jgi:hypothetical protein